jgi:hypothetical protein
MKTLLKIKIACEILLELGEDAQCIAFLDWKSIPEAAVYQRAIVLKHGRVTFYKINSTKIVDIQGYGYFQIL